MNRDEVKALMAGGEGQTVEFKASTTQTKQAIKTLAAFASQPGGGIVLIGVNDDGSPSRQFTIGRQTQEQFAQDVKENTASLTTGLALTPEIYVLREPDVLVARVTTSHCQDGPFVAFGARWVRSGSTTNQVKMDYVRLARMFQEHLYDDESQDPLPYRFCERCGSEDLRRGSTTDYVHDRVYFMIRCGRCGWGDWTE